MYTCDRWRFCLNMAWNTLSSRWGWWMSPLRKLWHQAHIRGIFHNLYFLGKKKHCWNTNYINKQKRKKKNRLKINNRCCLFADKMKQAAENCCSLMRPCTVTSEWTTQTGFKRHKIYGVYGIVSISLSTSCLPSGSSKLLFYSYSIWGNKFNYFNKAWIFFIFFYTRWYEPHDGRDVDSATEGLLTTKTFIIHDRITHLRSVSVTSGSELS